MIPPCFVCGRRMHVMWQVEYTWKCTYCDVIEERDPHWFSRVRTIAGEKSAWGEITYLDHSMESYPSPGLYPQVRGVSPAVR